MSSQDLFAIGSLFLLFASVAFFTGGVFFNTRLYRQLACGLTFLSVLIFMTAFLGRWSFYVKEMGADWLESFPVVTIFETVSFSVLLSGVAILSITQLRSRAMFCSALSLIGSVSVLALFLYSSHVQPSLFLPSLKSYWLAAHVSLSFLAYVLFGISALAGVFVLFSVDCREYSRQIRNLLFSGTVIYTIGAIIFGAFWAQDAWGRFWAWDPKETCAFITWIFYALAVHLTARGRLSDKGTAWCAIICFLTVLFSYFIVNWLFVGLHSYVAV